MPRVHSIDEDELTEAGQDGAQAPPCPGTSSTFELKDTIMNSKLLYAATVAVSLLGTLAMADNAAAGAAPLTRAQVNADLATAVADGTLQRTDYDADARAAAALSTTTRAQVVAELADARTGRKSLIGAAANRTYNPFGAEFYRPSVVTRAQVNADVLEAAAGGTLQRSDYDDAALVARRANAHAASSKQAQRVKAALSRRQG